jgi:hypothetical protein
MELKMAKQKILVELEVDIQAEGLGGNLIAKLSHPDLTGHLYLRAGSQKMMEVQMDHINANKEPSDPISILVNGASKLIESAKELKEMAVKK